MFKNLIPSALGITGHQSEIIELALTYGFAGMDLNVEEFASRVKSKGLDYAKRLIESAGIRIAGFTLPVELEAEDEQFKEQLKKLAEYASYVKELNCTLATVLLAPAGDTRPYHENFELHRARLQEICSTLEPSGVRLAVGFQAAEYLRRDCAFQFVHDLDAVSLMVNMAASPNLGLLLDIWDVVAGGGTLESVQKLPVEKIFAVRVADMPAGIAVADLDENSRILPGGENGQIDVAGFLAYLRESGYDGPVSLKPSRSAFSTRRRDMIVKQASEVLDSVLNPQPKPAVEAVGEAVGSE